MTCVDLIAVTDEDSAARVLSSGDALFDGCVAVAFDGLVALLSPPFKAGWFERERAALIRRLERDQKRLETLLRYGPVLPATGAARLKDKFAATALLVSTADTLRSLLASHGRLVQFQIQVDLNTNLLLSAHADSQDLVTAIAEADDTEAGVRAFVDQQRELLTERGRSLIAAAARDIVMLPTHGPETILNIVALIDRAEEPALDAAVAAVDALASSALKIRFTGPLPPVSFAGLCIEEPKDAAIAAASRLLGVALDASTEAVRGAYYAQAKVLHSDVNAEAVPGAMAELTDAYRLMVNLSKARQGAGGAAAPLLRIRREGDIMRAA